MDYQTATGWLSADERDMLVALARHIPPDQAIVNIGVEYGASLVCLRTGAPSARLVGIDLDCTKLIEPIDAELWTGDSGRLIKRWKADPIGLLFVDGDHSERGVKSDIAWTTHIPIGGIVAFHDCYDWDGSGQIHRICPGVNAAVERWLTLNPGTWHELPWITTTRMFQRMR